MIRQRAFFLFAVPLICGCYTGKPKPAPVETIVVTEPAAVPEGTQENCWQEPRVVEQKVGPGLDDKSHWYNPPHNEVREVKMGRWVPCEKR